jgi:uncharacterized protein with FMN-binding domain
MASKKHFLRTGLIAGAAVLLALIAFGAFYGMRTVRGLIIEDVNLSLLPDGTYSGSYSMARWTYDVTIAVKDGRIVDVAATSGKPGKADDFSIEAAAEVVRAQSPLIDTVSGASLNTKAFAKAVQNALMPAAAAP